MSTVDDDVRNHHDARVVRRYFRRRWRESRGDEYDSWGRSTWWFETDRSGVVLRQIETYDSGQRLRYDGEHKIEDEFGGVSEKPLEIDDFLEFEIEAGAFEREWNTGGWTNA